MTVGRRALAALAAAGIATLGTSARAATDPVVKASINCRKMIAQQATKVLTTGLKIAEKCHDQRDKGKLPLAIDCNDLAVADLKGKLPTNAQPVAAKIAAAIDKKCAPGEVVRLNYPGGDVEEALFAIVEAQIEASGADLQGAPDLTDKKEDKDARGCHKEIAKARTKLVNAIVKGAVKCQQKADKSATVFGELLAACFTDTSKVAAGARTKLDKKCLQKSLAGADVGSCEPLPDCALDAAEATGETLARAVYGVPPECGNGVVETGETCDDGDLEDGDGCDSSCTPTGCGNGVVSAGEQCDDGNALDSDACVACEDAVCGDGAVHAGVELCGDDPSVCPFGTGTCPQGDCSLAAAGPSVAVSFAVPPGQQVGSLRILLDYPETAVGLPGFGLDAGARVTQIPAGLSVVNDEDYALRVSLTSLGGAIPAGRFFTAAFDVCTGAPAGTLDQFACIVEEAFDPTGVDPVAVTCTVTSP